MESSIKDVLRKLRRHVLSSPVRLAVALTLFVKGGMEFGELQRALEIAPGTLWSHLAKMNEEGVVRLRKKLTPFGPRTIVELTDRGKEIVVEYVRAIDKLISLLDRGRESG